MAITKSAEWQIPGMSSKYSRTLAPSSLSTRARRRFRLRGLISGPVISSVSKGGREPSRSYPSRKERLGSRPPFETLLITGPLMSPRKRKRLLARVERLEGASVLEYFEDIPGI